MLAGALRNHGALSSLELGYNPLGPEGTKTITDLAKFQLPKVGELGERCDKEATVVFAYRFRRRLGSSLVRAAACASRHWHVPLAP